MRSLTNPLELAAAAVVGLLLLVSLTRLVHVLRRHANRAQVVTVGLLVPAAMGLGLSASTSYRFAGVRLGITDLPERMILCGTAEAAIIALTLHAWGTRSKASAWLAYALVAVQAVPAFSVSGGAGGVVRIVLGPVLLAVMLHLLLGLEVRFNGEKSQGLLASLGRELKERLTASLGIGRRGADSAEIARSRAADRAVALASGRRLSHRSTARLAVAIDAARHGLADPEADAAEASIVARVVRRKSVADLHGLTARHVWLAPAVSAVRETGPAAEETAEPPANPGPDPRPRPGRRRTRKPNRSRTPDQLLAEARELHEASLAENGVPATPYRLRTELRIGHPAAKTLLAQLTAPVQPVPNTVLEQGSESVVEHVNGTPV